MDKLTTKEEIRKLSARIIEQSIPTLALVMIVKDEAGVIKRALDSIRPLIDYVLICDTGSSDDTKKIIENWLELNDVTGKVLEEPWQNFGYNRSYLLEKLRELKPNIDYAFMLDADEVVTIEGNPKLLKQQLKESLYNVDMRLGTTAYALPRITSNRLPFYYRGPVHEWPDCKSKFTLGGSFSGVTITELSGGAREKDPNVYRRDAELFEEELKRTDLDATEKTRYTFYLAQSLRDCGEIERSLEAYFKRVDLGGWPEEVYISLLNSARMQERLGKPLTEILKTYKRAIGVNPKRLEAIHGLTRVLRVAKLYHESFNLALPYIRTTSYTGLFVETWIYDYGLLDEFSISAYYAGNHSMAWLAMQVLLGKKLDDATKQRVTANIKFAALAK